MSTPTDAQIKQVQTNLKNMQSLNDYIYTYGQAKILNAYLLLTEVDDPDDPGLTVVLNLLEGAFWGVGGELGPIGSFIASFCSGMINSWADAPPPSLNTTFADLISRFEATSVQTDQQLATYYTDPTTYWDTSFTYNGQTTTVGDLATIQVPAETDPDFETLAEAALFALDQTTWQQVLCDNMVVTWYDCCQELNLGGKQDDPPTDWVASFIKSNPAYYCTWAWHDGSGCGDNSGWIIQEYNVGTGASFFKDGSISKDACAYLFIDDGAGNTINKSGLYKRTDVFNNLGMKTATDDIPCPTPPVGEAVSFSYLKAHVRGKTLSRLIASKDEELGAGKGVKWVKKQIRKKAKKDPAFKRMLQLHPRVTMEKFLGVRIPEVLSLTVVVEDGRTFGVVIPQDDD
jgi:hypothetical protein